MVLRSERLTDAAFGSAMVSRPTQGRSTSGIGDRPIGLLIVLQDRHQRSTDGDRRAVERVDEVRALLPAQFVADVQPPGLVVGAVGGAGDFAPLARLPAAGHPRFQIVLAVGRAAQVAGGRVDHAVGNSQFVEQAAFQFAEVLEHGVALVGQGEGEHLDLRELVHAVQSPRSPARRAGLGAETVADPAQLDRQLLGVDDLAREQPARA